MTPLTALLITCVALLKLAKLILLVHSTIRHTLFKELTDILITEIRTRLGATGNTI